MSSQGPGEKLFDASFAHGDRYAPPASTEPVTVVVEGAACPGEVLGRNGPRTQVRYQSAGHSYVRWFDSDQVLQDWQVAD
ncbi:MAG: hypothetical protein JWO22_500 [Frankiales bacterium]|nr:hypothetical protein [Frankiales bacterium]